MVTSHGHTGEHSEESVSGLTHVHVIQLAGETFFLLLQIFTVHQCCGGNVIHGLVCKDYSCHSLIGPLVLSAVSRAPGGRCVSLASNLFSLQPTEIQIILYCPQDVEAQKRPSSKVVTLTSRAH